MALGDTDRALGFSSEDVFSSLRNFVVFLPKNHLEFIEKVPQASKRSAIKTLLHGSLCKSSDSGTGEEAFGKGKRGQANPLSALWCESVSVPSA